MTTQSLAGKVALITGGSKGIGKATAILFARHGASIVINYGSDKAAADSTLFSLPDSSNALAIQADAGRLSGIDKIISETIAKFNKIDILIACAASAPMKDTEATTEAEFDKTYALNVKGPYFLVQKAMPHMAPGSHVIHFSTSLCSVSNLAPHYLLYVSTKGAIEQITRVQAKDLARKGIFVNAVSPGPTGTDLFYQGKSEAVLEHIRGLTPFNRIGEPEAIADSILHLATSNWVSGQILPVNGTMAP